MLDDEADQDAFPMQLMYKQIVYCLGFEQRSQLEGAYSCGLHPFNYESLQYKVMDELVNENKRN